MATSFVRGGNIDSLSISNFDPKTLGGCTVWLDAADPNTLFTDTAGTIRANNGDTVNLWKDKSGNPNNATTAGLPSNNTANQGAVLVRDSVSNRTQLRFGTQTGTVTATTNTTGISFNGNISAAGISTISGISSIVGSMTPGMGLTGTGIPAGTIMVSYDSAAQTATMSSNSTAGNSGSNGITATLNTVTATFQTSPVVGQSFLMVTTFGNLIGGDPTYFIRHLVSYIETTAIFVLSTTNTFTNVVTVTNASGTPQSCDVGHSAYILPNASIPTGVSSSTHFIVFKPTINTRSQFPVSIGGYQGGGMREFNFGGNAAFYDIQITNNGTRARGNVVNALASTIMTGMFSNYIISGWIDGTSMATTNVDLQPATSNQFNTVTGYGLIGTRANTLPAYGLMSEYIQFNRALQNDERQQVEGYLAWKWGLVMNLPVTHPYYYSKAPQTAFQPTNFPSCILWLDAADTNSMVLSGSDVTRVIDKTGTNVNLGNAVGFTRSNTFNGSYPSFFNSTIGDRYLGRITSLTVNNPVTVFSVLQSQAVTGSEPYVYNKGSGSTRNYIYIKSSVSTTNARISAGATNADNPGSNINLSTPQVLSANFGASSTTLFTNGTAGTPVNISGTFTNGITVGGNSGDAVGGWLGHISEFIIFNLALTPAQRQQVEGYLGWKWGLQANFPATHPFALANYFFNNTRPFSRRFSPPDIEGCQLWIDAADATTVTLTSSKVTTVKDKSGLGNDVTNSSSILTYTDTLNGLNTITCPAGTNSSTNFLVTGSRPRDQFNHSYFVVAKYPSSGAVATRFIQMTNHFFGHSAQGTDNSTPSNVLIYLEDSNSIVNSETQYTFHSGTYATRNAALGGNTFICTSVRQNSIYTIAYNGVPPTGNTNSAGTGIGSVVGNSPSTAYTLRPPESTGGQLAEVIIYNRGLTTPERQIVEGYLAQKWGISNGITQVLAGNGFPTTHPYALYPPVTAPIPPSAKLYKNTFDPADLSPVLWFDPQDSATYATDGNNRLTSWTSKGSNKLQLGTIASVNGPLITTSATRGVSTTVSQGTGFQFADFSSGGYFRITAARLISTTDLELTLTPNHNIPPTRQVTFSQLGGTTAGGTSLSTALTNGSYIVASATPSTINITLPTAQGSTGTFTQAFGGQPASGAVEYGNISIASATVSLSSVTINTTQAHGLSTGDLVTLCFTAGTLPVSGNATSLNNPYTATKINDTQITVPFVSLNTGAITGPVGILIFPSAGCGLNWQSSVTPVTSSAGGTLVCVTHLARTPVRGPPNTGIPGFFTTATTIGGVAGSDNTDNGRDLRIAMGNAGMYIRKSNSVNGIPNSSQLTAGFNVMNATFSKDSVTGADITTGRFGISTKGWRYDTVLSNTDYNYMHPTSAPTTTLSFAQIRIGGNTEATSDLVSARWYEGGLGDVFFFDRVLTLNDRQLLEGWLSEKYGCNNTLGATAVNTGGAAVGSSIHPYRLNPTTISGQNTLGTPITSQTQISNNLAAWFDVAYSPTLSISRTSFTNTLLADGTAIDAWGSRAGSWSQAINGAGWVSQSISTRRPLYVTNSVNGLPGLRFSNVAASQSALDAASGSGRIEYTTITQDAHPNTTIIAVVKPITSSNGIIVNVGQISPNISVSLEYKSDSKITFSVNAGTPQSITSDALINANAYIVVARRRGTEMLLKTIGSGGTTKTSTVAAYSLIGGTAAYLRVGNSYSEGPDVFQGDINEFMIFRSGLTDQAIQQIEGYLAWKWGLQGSLPDTHAFKKVYI